MYPMDVAIRLLSSAAYAKGVESQSTGSRGFASAPWVDRANSFFTPTANADKDFLGGQIFGLSLEDSERVVVMSSRSADLAR